MNRSYESVIFSESITYSTTSLIQWIALMNQFFLVNQTHTVQLV